MMKTVVREHSGIESLALALLSALLSFDVCFTFDSTDHCVGGSLTDGSVSWKRWVSKVLTAPLISPSRVPIGNQGLMVAGPSIHPNPWRNSSQAITVSR